MVTASADTTAKLWDVPTGKNIFTFDFDRQGARGCAFSLGGREVVITVDPFMGTGSSIRVFKMFEDRAERARPVSLRVAAAAPAGADAPAARFPRSCRQP
jgi:translation initiation factor 3 subunit I